jgi:hypothetical protein
MKNKYDRLKFRRGNLDSLFTGRVLGRTHKLKKLIYNYPIYSPPYPSQSQTLSESQANQNYEYFKQEKSKRLNIWLYPGFPTTKLH